MNNTRQYVAFIGDRMVRMHDRNVWAAAYRAAIHFGSTLREGMDFFDGKAVMSIYRADSYERPLYEGDVAKWRDLFTSQRRVLRGAWLPKEVSSAN